MTGRIGAVAGLSSPGRSAPGLSIAMILGAGILGATFFVLVGLAALDSTKTTALTDWLPGSRGQQEAAYVALNVFLIGLLAVTWLRQAKALEVAHEHFKRVRSGAPLD